MPVLLYCAAELSASPDSQTGVAGSPVARCEESGVAIFYSENSSADLWLRSPLRASAKEFHGVQQNLFRLGPIIPFRFPTILESLHKLHDHVTEHADEYLSLLQQFANFVQMDLLLTHAGDSQPSSGTQYLRSRQSRVHALDRLAENFRNTVQSITADWRRRSSSNRLRCFALIDRGRIQEFNGKIKQVSIASDITARVSGPWPVAEFLDLKF